MTKTISFKKGTTLDQSFDKFILDSLVEVCSVKEGKHCLHDSVVKFKVDVKVTINIEEVIVIDNG